MGKNASEEFKAMEHAIAATIVDVAVNRVDPYRAAVVLLTKCWSYLNSSEAALSDASLFEGICVGAFPMMSGHEILLKSVLAGAEDDADVEENVEDAVAADGNGMLN